jgi:hypothetical protein
LGEEWYKLKERIKHFGDVIQVYALICPVALHRPQAVHNLFILVHVANSVYFVCNS